MLRSLFARVQRVPARQGRRIDRRPIRLVSLEERLAPALFIVTNGGDNGAPTQLRAVWEVARNNAGDDTIRFDSTVTTVTLTSPLNTYTDNAFLTVTGNGKTVTTIVAPANGRVFDFNVAGLFRTITINDLKLTGGNVADYGGAVRIHKERLILTNVAFAGNNAVSGGGALAVMGGGSPLTLTITGCDFTSNTATTTIDSSTTGGGAIYLGWWATINLDSCKFDANRAVSGSSVFCGSSVSFNSDFCTFNNGVSTGVFGPAGGALFFYSGATTVTIGRATVTGNTTSNRGGFLYAYNFGARVTIQNSTISSNRSADQGGALRVQTGSTVTLTNTMWSNNSAGHDGGALHGGGLFTIDKSTFTNNTALFGGGAAYSIGGTITSSLFANNVALGNEGGALGNYIGTVNFSQFNGNSAAVEGGAIGNMSGSSITINNSTFSKNKSAATGGAVAVGTAVRCVVNQSTFNGNIASSGGAIANLNASTLTLNSCTIYGNTANGNSASAGGGGLYRSAGFALNFSSNIIANNVVPFGTKGIDLYSATTVTVAGTGNLIGTNDNSSVTFSNPSQNQLGTNASRIDARLAPLADNGGEEAKALPDGTHVQTMVLLPGSPALNKGLANGFANDQRGAGFPRNDGNGVDVGAFEGLSPFPSAVLAEAPDITAAGNGFYDFSVIYQDDAGFDTTTFDQSDVTVAGPGYGSGVQPTSLSIAGGGIAYTVTYTVPPPTGGWGGVNAADGVNLGAYTITLNPGQVADSGGTFISGNLLGTFRTAFAAKFVVSDTSDADDGKYGGGKLSFREALNLANANAGIVDSITFDPILFSVAKTIALTAGPRVISDSVVITGPSQVATLDAQRTNQQFTVLAGKSVTVSNLKFTRFHSPNSGGAFTLSAASLSLTNTNFSFNTAVGSGGAIEAISGSTVTVNRSAFSDNAGTQGGALNLAGTLSVVQSLFSGNSAATSGGALYLGGVTSQATITTTLFSGNTAGSAAGGGGAIRAATLPSVVLSICQFNENVTLGSGAALSTSSNLMTLTSTTFRGNSAGVSGGAVLHSGSGDLTINQSTIARNTAAGANGGSAIHLVSSGILRVNNSTIYDNYGGAAVVRSGVGPFVPVSSIIAGSKSLTGVATPDLLNTAGATTLDATRHHNLIGNNSSSSFTFADTTTNQIGTTASPINPVLAALGDFGGEFALVDGTHVHTLPLRQNSPALDKGDANGFTFDQRGNAFSRVLGSQADVGAFEGSTTLPFAVLTMAPGVPSASNFPYSFEVNYIGTAAIDASTFDLNDVLVTGGGYGSGQKAALLNVGGSGGSYTVTYTVTAPASGWGGANIGRYTIAIRPKQVQDVAGNFVPGGPLGTFVARFATAVVVNEPSDIDDGNLEAGNVSFREALRLVEGNTGFTNTITFDPIAFAAPTTIHLVNAAMPITQPVVINGPAAGVTFNGQGTNKQFVVSATTVTLSKLHFTSFSASANGGVFNFTATNSFVPMSDVSFTYNRTGSGGGGAISVLGTNSYVLLNAATFSHNTAFAGSGGAIRFAGTGYLDAFASKFRSNVAVLSSGGAVALNGLGGIYLEDSTVSGNVAGNNGGGLYSFGVTVINSSIVNNVAASVGGGWAGAIKAASTTLTFDRALVAGNSADRGGGIFAPSNNLFVSNSTFSGNSAAKGGGIYTFVGVRSIRNTTITNNTAAANGGGIFTSGTATTITFSSNILAGNSAGIVLSTADASSSFTFAGNNNLIGIADGLVLSGTKNQTGTAASPLDPRLFPLADNGGKTLTHALKTDSPALDAGVANGFTTDQRGRPRTVDLPNVANAADGTDIGAFEFELPPRVTGTILGDGTAQRSTVRQMVVTFSEPVTFTGPVADAFRLTRSGIGAPIDDVELTASPATGPAGSVTLTFSGDLTEFNSLIDGFYDLTIDASEISTTIGPLDGNGDLTGGDNFVIVGNLTNKFFRLFGDANGDGFVDNVDLLAFRTANGSQSGQANFNPAFDHNNDGFIDNVDFLRFRRQMGLSP